MLLKILTVAVFAFGFLLWIIFFASITGGLIAVFVAAFLGDKIRLLFYKNKPAKEKKQHPLMLYKIWNKYGIVGLGFFGTMSVGAPISITVAVSLNANIKIAYLVLGWCNLSLYFVYGNWPLWP